MNKDRIKTELDIEEILLAKNYEDLSFREKEFVENQVDSEEEYRGLRNTLLSIKHYSSEQERIVAPARIKEELMELMEKQNKSFAWFSLEGIANWLFPSGVRLFQKPGFQIAGFAMLVLLALNIGFDFVPKKQGQLAINTIKKNEIELPKNIPVQPEQKEREENLQVLENPQSSEPKVSKNENPPVLNELAKEPRYTEELVTDDFNLEENLATKDVPEEVALDMVEIGVTDNDKLIESPTLGSNAENVLQFTARDQANVTTLNEVEVIKTKKKKAKLASQNLKSHEDVIDLLFVAL